MASTIAPVIIVHGGAREIPMEDVESWYPGVQEAVREGYKILQDGSALDAVERAICCLEDNPRYNAGDIIIIKPSTTLRLTQYYRVNENSDLIISE